MLLSKKADSGLRNKITDFVAQLMAADLATAEVTMRSILVKEVLQLKEDHIELQP